MNELTKQSASPNVIASLICILAFAWYGWFLTPGMVIDSHVGLSSSVVLDHHVDLNRYFRNTGERACIGRNYYSTKAPGTALLAVPSLTYWSFKRVVEPADPWQVWFMALFTTALPSALIAALLFLFVYEAAGRDAGAALLAALGYAFATAAFPEATLFSAHQPVALMLLALFLMGYGAHGRARCGLATDVAFGFVLAMTVVTEYASAMPGAVLAVYYLAARRAAFAGAAAAVFAGALIPLAGWCAYNVAVFGHAFDFATRYPCLPQSHKPAAGLFQSLFMPSSGLMFTSPLILLSLPGLWFMARRPQLRNEALALGCSILATSACHIRGGAREIVPMLPLCAAAAGFFLRHLTRGWRMVAIGGLALCAAFMWLLVITMTQVPDGISLRAAQSALFTVRHGMFRPTILSGLTTNMFLQLAPPVVITIAAGFMLFRAWSRDASIKLKSNIP